MAADLVGDPLAGLQAAHRGAVNEHRSLAVLGLPVVAMWLQEGLRVLVEVAAVRVALPERGALAVAALDQLQVIGGDVLGAGAEFRVSQRVVATCRRPPSTSGLNTR